MRFIMAVISPALAATITWSSSIAAHKCNAGKYFQCTGTYYVTVLDADKAASRYHYALTLSPGLARLTLEPRVKDTGRK